MMWQLGSLGSNAGTQICSAGCVSGSDLPQP